MGAATSQAIARRFWGPAKQAGRVSSRSVARTRTVPPEALDEKLSQELGVGSRDPLLDDRVVNLSKGVSGHSRKHTEDSELAERRRQRAQRLEEAMVGRLSTSALRDLLRDPVLKDGVHDRAAIRDVAERFGAKEEVLWRVLGAARVPPIRQTHAGYLMADKWVGDSSPQH